MKMILMLMLVFSYSAFSQIYEFNCRKDLKDDSRLFIEVERTFRSSTWRDVNVTRIQEDETQVKEYRNVWLRRRPLNKIALQGSGMDLQIDLWPDQIPRWGRRYRSTFRSYDFMNGDEIRNIYCTYNGIRK